MQEIVCKGTYTRRNKPAVLSVSDLPSYSTNSMLLHLVKRVSLPEFASTRVRVNAADNGYHRLADILLHTGFCARSICSANTDRAGPSLRMVWPFLASLVSPLPTGAPDRLVFNQCCMTLHRQGCDDIDLCCNMEEPKLLHAGG